MVTQKNQRFEGNSSDKPKLPTLRQIFPEIGRGKYSLCAGVCTIFVNSNYGNYTLVTDEDYRVIVYAGTALHAALESGLEDLADSGNVCMWVYPDPEKAGKFDLELDYGQEPIWKHFEWGYAIEGYSTAKKLATDKTPHSKKSS